MAPIFVRIGDNWEEIEDATPRQNNNWRNPHSIRVRVGASWHLVWIGLVPVVLTTGGVSNYGGTFAHRPTLLTNAWWSKSPTVHSGLFQRGSCYDPVNKYYYFANIHNAEANEWQFAKVDRLGNIMYHEVIVDEHESGLSEGIPSLHVHKPSGDIIVLVSRSMYRINHTNGSVEWRRHHTDASQHDRQTTGDSDGLIYCHLGRTNTHRINPTNGSTVWSDNTQARHPDGTDYAYPSCIEAYDDGTNKGVVTGCAGAASVNGHMTRYSSTGSHLWTIVPRPEYYSRGDDIFGLCFDAGQDTIYVRFRRYYARYALSNGAQIDEVDIGVTDDRVLGNIRWSGAPGRFYTPYKQFSTGTGGSALRLIEYTGSAGEGVHSLIYAIRHDDLRYIRSICPDVGVPPAAYA